MTDRPADLETTEARLREFLSAEVARARLDYPGLASRPHPRSTLSLAPLVAVSLMVVTALLGAGLLASRSWSDRQGGVAAPSPSATATCQPEDLDRFLESIQIVDYDYDPFDTPREQTLAADLVVVGRFVAADPGRSDVSPGQRRGRLTVAVETVIAGDRSAVHDGHVFVELPVRSFDIEPARDSLPANRVMLFLDSSGDPSIFAPFVQGVLLETCPGYVSGLESLEHMSPAWREAATFDEFVALASPVTSPTASPVVGTVDILLVRVEPPPGVFPAMGGHVAFVEIRPARGGELLHEVRLRDQNTTVQLAQGLYTASTRVDVYGDVLLEGESEPPSYGEVARCPDVELEVVSGLTTPLTVTVQEPDPTCSAVAGAPAPSQTRAPVPSGTGAPCPDALIEGTLLADGRQGLELAGSDGVRRPILWPPGYTTLPDARGFVLYDASGTFVTRDGDFVSLGGGERGSDGPWLACGDITVMDSGHESLLRGLREAGLDAHVGSRFGPGPFPGSGVALCVAGESLQVYEFRTEALAQAAVTSIDPGDPSHVGDSVIEWVGHPKFWHGKRFIVLYAGSAPGTEDALDALLGEPFAVGSARGGFPEEHDC